MEITKTNTELTNELTNNQNNNNIINIFLEKKEDLLKNINERLCKVIEIYHIPLIVINIYEFIKNNQLNNELKDKDQLRLVIKELFIHLFKNLLVIDHQVESLLNSSIELLLLKVKVNKRIISFKNINCFN